MTFYEKIKSLGLFTLAVAAFSLEESRPGKKLRKEGDVLWFTATDADLEDFARRVAADPKDLFASTYEAALKKAKKQRSLVMQRFLKKWRGPEGALS